MELRKEFPKGVIELSTVPGLSVEKIKQLDEAGHKFCRGAKSCRGSGTAPA